jgi:selenide,water dikinase
MGGKPIMAIAILGWPVNLLAPEIAQKVIEGGRAVCADAGISLAGGHSIDTPEPIFGLAVTGIVATEQVKRNNQAEDGCLLFLTKPLGIGILTTAEKQSKLQIEHRGVARDWMCQLNKCGESFAQVSGVKAMTDVTGFGLLGHLSEICEGSKLKAEIYFDKVPHLPAIFDYIEKGCVPGGTGRNYASYGDKIAPITETQKALLCDPQTSGGLLIAVQADAVSEVSKLAQSLNIELHEIGKLKPLDGSVLVEVI